MTEHDASLEDAEAEILDLVARPEPDPAAIVDVIRRIEASRDAADPDVAAALGYFWYLVPGDDARRVTEGERWLEDALRRQPNHALVSLDGAPSSMIDARWLASSPDGSQVLVQQRDLQLAIIHLAAP